MSIFMKKAVRLAQKAAKKTYPNPCVGAVIVKNNQIVASGYHKKAGQPHAEVNAINDAKKKGINLSESTIYVTLEPCNHQGRTPPCTQAILNAGIKNVVIGCVDNNPNVKGGGASFLKENDVNVTIGDELELCQSLIEDFTIWKNLKRPYVTLKMATTLDGKIATNTGDSSWISCETSRNDVQKLRTLSQAVLIGENTFYNDNPRLNVRLKNATKQPLAVVTTRKLPNITDDKYLIKNRISETIFFTSGTEKNSKNAYELENLGCKINIFENFQTTLNWLFENKKCYYLLCEGGGFLANELLKQNLIDEFIQYIAPISLGDETAKNVFYGNNINYIKDARRWLIKDHKKSGSDLKLTLKPLRIL